MHPQQLSGAGIERHHGAPRSGCGIKHAVHHERVRCAEERIAVGQSLRHELHPDDRAAARAVVHDDGSSPPLAQLLRPEAAHDIEAATGRDPDHDPYRLLRIVSRPLLRMGQRCGTRRNSKRGSDRITTHESRPTLFKETTRITPPARGYS